jgi:NAD(P)-dependent dehydrogenase (short-subunit alcohol dehydrogenase family)
MTQTPLAGRVAVVTRAASDIAEGIVRALVRSGASVGLGAAGDGHASSYVDEMMSAGRAVRAWTLDAARPEGATELLSEAVRAFGRVDIMVNTTVLTAPAPAETMPLAAFTAAVHLNLDAMFFGCQAAARQMLAQDPPGGTIINLTSAAGVVAIPGYTAFCAAMAGITEVTKVLATEWGPMGIRVAGLGTGLTAELAAALPVHPKLPDGVRLSHRRLPLSALASQDDLGDALIYLASDGARHVAGTTLYVDGGWLADGYWE